jgi:hypothetical protein
MTAAVIELSAPAPASSTGLFLNLPRYFDHIDTSRVQLEISQSLVEGEYESSSVFAFDLGFRGGERTRARMQILYPVIRRNGLYNYGFADILMSGRLSIVSDSMRASGLFLRGDLRIPAGSESLWPYAGESLDGGGGIEARRISSTVNLRFSLTYILAERRIKEEGMRHENYTLAALLVGVLPASAVTIDLSAFAQFFRNGDYREVYLLTAAASPAGGIEVRLCGGIDSGGREERIWNSMVQVSLLWRLPVGTGPSEPTAGERPEGATNP